MVDFALSIWLSFRHGDKDVSAKEWSRMPKNKFPMNQKNYIILFNSIIEHLKNLIRDWIIFLLIKL